MARVKVHTLCRLPLSECTCPDDDEDEMQPEEDAQAAEDETR